MSESPELSIVLPCRNQADHILPVLQSYLPVLEKAGIDFELVVVPNASADGTEAIVRSLANEDARVRTIENPDGGWGRSVLTGLQHARGDILCYTNTARTNPDNIPPLLELYRANAPCLAKVRRVERDAPVRSIGSTLYNLEGRLLFGIQVDDVNGTPKIMSRECFEQLELFSPGDLIDMELLAKLKRHGIPVVEMDVPGFQRHGGKSSTNWKSAWNMYAGAWSLRKSISGKAA